MSLTVLVESRIRNVKKQLLELREDQRLAEVTDEGDTLTAFKQQSRSGAGSNMEEDDDVVILSPSWDGTKDSELWGFPGH